MKTTKYLENHFVFGFQIQNYKLQANKTNKIKLKKCFMFRYKKNWTGTSISREFITDRQLEESSPKFWDIYLGR